MKTKNNLTIDFMVKNLELAKFKIRYINKEHKYVTAEHPDTNTYIASFQIYDGDQKGLTGYLKTEDDFFKQLFEECKKVGRIQIRSKLSKIINMINYE